MDVNIKLLECIHSFKLICTLTLMEYNTFAFSNKNHMPQGQGSKDIVTCSVRFQKQKSSGSVSSATRAVI